MYLSRFIISNFLIFPIGCSLLAICSLLPGSHGSIHKKLDRAGSVRMPALCAAGRPPPTARPAARPPDDRTVFNSKEFGKYTHFMKNQLIQYNSMPFDTIAITFDMM